MIDYKFIFGIEIEYLEPEYQLHFQRQHGQFDNFFIHRHGPKPQSPATHPVHTNN